MLLGKISTQLRGQNIECMQLVINWLDLPDLSCNRLLRFCIRTGNSRAPPGPLPSR